MQRIRITEINYAIRWIVIYPLESAIRRLNNRGLIVNQHNKIFVRVGCVLSLSLSRIPLSDVFTVRFIAEMSDVESVKEKSKPKDPSANPKTQSSELVDDVFSLFKGYLNTKLEAQARLIEGQSKIQRSASEFQIQR